MGRIRKTVDFGNERHITNVNAPMFGNHNSRGVNLRDTSEAVKKVNEEHSIADHNVGICKQSICLGR